MGSLFFENGSLIYDSWFKLALILVLGSFLPLIAWSYYRFRKGIREREIIRALEQLGANAEDYEGLYVNEFSSRNYMVTVLCATIITLVGLTALILGLELELGKKPNLLLGGLKFLLPASDSAIPLAKYQQGALHTFAMAFIGAYIWGVYSLVHRYTMNDLRPSAYLYLGVRIIVSGFMAILLYHLYGALNENTVGVLPAFAFFIGMFPESGIAYIQEKLPLLIKPSHSLVRNMPLYMIEGVTNFDKIRLSEIGIDTCYDLACADFLRIFVKTPYQPRELIDWILQAKLCVSFGDLVGELRGNGIRTVSDLHNLTEDNIVDLCKESGLKESHLRRVINSSKDDPGVMRLKKARLIFSAAAVPPVESESVDYFKDDIVPETTN